MHYYRPYPKQAEFHAAGATHRERLLMAGNRTGKTFSAGAETAYHLTGRYPDWWTGKRFDRPVQWGAASETSLLTRDGVQRILFGWPAAPLGTGMIPGRALVGEPTRSKFGPGDTFEMARVRHVSGGESLLYLRSYDQGRERIQAMELDGFWFDEEPDLDYYLEALTRTNLTMGPVYLTFTPLKGMSDVVGRFLVERIPGTNVTQMMLADAEHFGSPEQRAAIEASYPPHERDARTKGVPVLGSGRVFPVEEGAIAEEALGAIPEHWPRIAALDFGWDHPTAAVWLAYDRETDTVHLYDCYRRREQPVAIHASAIRARGDWIPVAWPHDGNNDSAAGPQLSKQYADEGLKMLPNHAQYQPINGSTQDNARANLMSVEAGVQDMLNRMNSGRLKVARHLNDWFEEFRLYHRKDGKIVKERDDLLSATRYGIMCLSSAETPPIQQSFLRYRPLPNWRAS